jgi:hypothetical protein
VKLAVYYLIVSVAYGLLYAVRPELAKSAVVGFVAVMLLIPAVYDEFLRVRRR